MIRERFESDDCKAVAEKIYKYNVANARNEEREKYNLMRQISFFRCVEAFHFLETQIKTNPVEEERCNAIKFLAWMLEPDYLSSILEYANRGALTLHEKGAVATAFMVFGTHFSFSNLKEQAIKILDEICWDAPEDILAVCILNYFNLKGEMAKNFFYSQLEQEEYKLHAALFLAQLGEHKQTFPIFAEALNSNDEYDIQTAVMGLAAIGTEEAKELVINLPPEKNRYHPKEPQINFNLMDLKKGEKQ